MKAGYSRFFLATLIILIACEKEEVRPPQSLQSANTVPPYVAQEDSSVATSQNSNITPSTVTTKQTKPLEFQSQFQKLVKAIDQINLPNHADPVKLDEELKNIEEQIQTVQQITVTYPELKKLKELEVEILKTNKKIDEVLLNPVPGQIKHLVEKVQTLLKEYRISEERARRYH
ncbi:MAG: hypothetical protein WDW19_04340 [Neisseriaceae bacterium]